MTRDAYTDRVERLLESVAARMGGPVPSVLVTAEDAIALRRVLDAALSRPAPPDDLVSELADKLEHMIRFRHDEAHNGDVHAGGRYDACPLCAETRAVIVRARALAAPTPGAAPAPAVGSPMPLVHYRSCGALVGNDCTCGLDWRIRLVTEQEMHAAWRKRAEECEAVAAPAPETPAPDAMPANRGHQIVARDRDGMPWCETCRKWGVREDGPCDRTYSGSTGRRQEAQP